MNEPDRLYLLERLERLGAEDDGEALRAARELAARVAENGLDWDELLAPEDLPEDGFGAEDYEPGDDGDGAEEEPPLEGDGAAELQLLQKLLERKGASRALREELQELRRDSASGEGLSDMDRRYIQALAKRLAVR